ncbi:MAG: ribonuclease D [Chthoniobacterales bacterium]|nr:ribonuclease D [Chthoniobacterales bacterium]
MISSQEQLADFVSRLAPHPVIGLDTEADSLHCYREKICLVQISSPEGGWLIDPLAGLDLSALYASLSRHRIIIHGADYDLRLLARHGSFHAADIFDTSIAARFLGLEQIGYGALVQQFFGVTLNKSSQRANWGRRPLPPVMEDYALNDVRYLLPLGEILESRLRELGRWDWYLQSRDLMVRNAREPRERDVENAWRISGSSKLHPREAAVLRALWHWREAEAEAWNRPTFHVMSNDRLLDAARDAVVGKPVQVHRMPPPRHARMKETLRTALELPEAEWPVFVRERKPRPSGSACRLFEQLRQKRDRIAGELKIDPSLIASRSTLMCVAQHDGVVLLPWQNELLEIGNDA